MGIVYSKRKIDGMRLVKESLQYYVGLSDSKQLVLCFFWY